MTREQIGRVWAAVCDAQADVRVEVAERTLVSGFAGQPVRAWQVFPGDPPERRVWVARAWLSRECCARAYGLTDDEALAALWELVCLHARVRRDEINAALAAGGA